MTVRRLLRIGLNVENLDVAQEFYIQALGFSPVGEIYSDLALTRLLGVRRSQSCFLALGEQCIELTVCDPPGLPCPDDTSGADTWFQCFTMATPDIAAAFGRLRRFRSAPTIQDGPQLLPAASGGGIAYRFRDPDGHPLELVQFAGNATPPGIDHAAISVTDIGLSLPFYEHLGLSRVSQPAGTGPERDRLEGLRGASVDVVGMRLLDQPTPYIALLEYRGPPCRAMITDLPDIVATRLVFEGDTSNGEPTVLFDPDGHALVITPDPIRETSRLRSTDGW